MAIGPGSVIGDRYTLERELGVGGMAEVYLAHDEVLDRRVAVKVLSARYAADPSFVERFRREASAAAGLNHPNIVAVYDRGETNGSYYIVMEYLEGPSLKDVVRRDAPLPPAAAIDYVLQILAALGAAHRRDIVHLDIKPQNMLLADNGLVKVTDFGIARAGGRSDLTATGSVIGTAQYLSPEQARGEDVTAASDCYSTGIVLYELLTGRVPFDGEQPMGVALKQINEPPPPPRVHVPEIPADLNAVVMKALAKRPSERFRTAEEFASALTPIRERFGGAPTGVGATQVLRREPEDATTRVARRTPPPPRPEPKSSRAWWIAAVVVLGIAALATGLWLISGGTGGDGGGILLPDVRGQEAADAQRELEQLGLTRVVQRQTPSDEIEEGFAIRTQPSAGQRVAPDTRVILEISSGPDAVPLPDVRGRTVDDAQAVLIRAGFDAQNIVLQEVESDQEKGRVVGQSPPPGEASPDATITLQVSSGPAEVTVPDLSGADRSTAVSRLSDLGLDPRVRGEESGDFVPNTVIRTEPGAGSTIDKGSQIVVVVAQTPSSREVPSVIGESESSGTAILQNAGFSVSTQSATSTSPAGQIIDQSPGGGTSAPPGSSVLITVSTGPAVGGGDDGSAPPQPEEDG
jgi:beta-lactam-binding protein with PASTA domain